MNRYHLNTINYLRASIIAAICIIGFIICPKYLLADNIVIAKATDQVHADSTRFELTGRVIDDAGQPLPGATVFISNSKWAAATDNQGVFKISGMPAGNYEVLVRMMGFITFTKVFTITVESVAINVALKPDAVALNEVKITAKPDANRARYLKTFTEIFLGRSENARKSKILNSDVLRFSYDKATGTLTARSTDFVKVDNAALGYGVNYLLNAFSFNQNDQFFGYNGKVYFEELQGDEQKQKVWKKNRLSVYYGSMQHFFKALFAGTTLAEGFKVYKIADSELGQSSNISISTSARSRSTNIARTGVDRANLRPVKPDSLFKTVGMNKVLKLPLLVKDGDTTRFYISYDGKSEPSEFLNSGMHLNIPFPNTQISSVYQVVPDNIILNKDGSLLPEQSLLLQGYWAWPRVADMLPTEIEGILEVGNTIAKEADLLNKPVPVEKIHIQMDRPWYLTGDTAWMKVYIVDENNKPSLNSKICYVELIDGNKHIVKNLRLPVNTGMAWGELALNDSLVKKGAYMLRIYTNETEKNNNSFFYKAIRIADLTSATVSVKSFAAAKQQSGLVADSLKVQFFPEGGALVTDVSSRMALMVTASGSPVSKLPGYIADEDGSHIIKFETNDKGISAFNIKPLTRGKYWAVLTLSNGKEKRFAFPAPQPSGIVMAIKQNDDDIVIYLNARDINKTPLLLTVKAKERVQYQSEKLLALAKDSIVISKSEVPEGLLQFNLHYPNKAPIAERMMYNQNKRQRLHINLVPNKTTYSPHDKVDINIAVADENGNPVSGNFSVSVNNEADVPQVKDETILTGLLMPGNDRRKLKQYDLTALTAEGERELDDMLLTMKPGVPIISNSQYQQAQAPPDSTFFAIKGQVNTARNKPAGSSVVGLFFPLGGPVLTSTSDNHGRFVFDNIPIKRGDPFYAVAKDKNKDLIVVIDKYQTPIISNSALADTVELHEQSDYVFKRINELKTNNILGIALKEVLIMEKQAEPTLKQLVRQRSSNLGGTPDQTLTFIDLLGCNLSTLGECLALKLNGVQLFNDSTHRPKLVARGRSTEPMAVFVDGLERPEALGTLPASIVASVEVLKGANAAAYGFRSGHGVVVITTKGGDIDYWAHEQEYYVPGSTKVPAIRRYRFEDGFDIPRDYYSPDYTTIQSNVIDKWRPTIYWNPNVTTGNDGKTQLSYFTNSAPGTYRITIEGIDGYGRIARQVFKYTVSK